MMAILAALALSVAAVGVSGWLVRTDRAPDLLTPEPERVVQSFVGALAARRPASAEQHLAESARTGAAARDLGAWADELRTRHGDFRFADGEAARDGDAAEVRARLRTTRAGTVERTFQLTRDPQTRLWKISGFDRRR